MKSAEIRTLFLNRFDIHLDPQMCDYVTRKLRAGAPLPDTLPVMGGNAYTGLPVRYLAPTVAIDTDDSPSH